MSDVTEAEKVENIRQRLAAFKAVPSFVSTEGVAFIENAEEDIEALLAVLDDRATASRAALARAMCEYGTHGVPWDEAEDDDRDHWLSYAGDLITESGLPSEREVREDWVNIIASQFTSDIEYTGDEVIGRIRAIEHTQEPHDSRESCIVCENDPAE